MENTERTVRTWIATESSSQIDELASELINGQTTWLNVVKALGEFLTSEEDEPRKKGVELLAQVLERVPTDKINRQSTHVMITFLCSKLDDYATVVPALKGLLALSSSKSCTSEDAVKIVQSVFQHVKMKALVQSERLIAWSIVDRIISKHRDALKALGSEFVGSYVNFADGEKDPRNLVIAFAVARVILIEFDVKPWVESLFNITFCYFPIAYRPPPNDPYHISTDDLRNALRACLSALPDFGPLAIPVFLEKLLAGAPPAKRDTLQTMSICLPVYGTALARNWARKLWNSLKLEIFQPTDPQTEALALQTVQVLIRTIYSDQESAIEKPEEDIQGLARDACEECLNILKEPEKSQARPAMKVLCSFVGEDSTPGVSRYTISQAVPHLLALFKKPEEAPTRGATLALLTDLLEAVRNAQARPSSEGAGSLEEYKDDILGSLTVGLKISAARIPALKGLEELVLLPNPVLTNEEIGFVVHNANELMQEDEDDDYRDDLLSLLNSISSLGISGAQHVEAQVLPLLFSSLPDLPPSRSSSAERSKYWKTLDSLKSLCQSAPLFEVFVIRLTTKLELLLDVSQKAQKEDDQEPLAAYAHSILRTILQTLDDKVRKKSPDADVVKYIDRLVPRVFEAFLRSATASSGGGGEEKAYAPFSDPRLLTVGGDIIGRVVRTLPSSRQEAFVTSLYAAFFDGKVEEVIENKKTKVTSSFAPFSNESSTRHKNTVVLFAGALVPLRRDVPLPVPSLSEHLRFILDWGLHHAENKLQRDSAWRTLAAILNKKADELTAFLDYITSEFHETVLKNRSLELQERRLSVEPWAWILKALLVRSHPTASQITEQLFAFLENNEEVEEMRWGVARMFGFVTASSSSDGEKKEEEFSKANGFVIKMLYAQRFAQGVLPRIMRSARDGKDSKTQVTHLIALTSLVTSLPKSVYVSEISSLMPLLLLSLDLPDPSIRTNVIETLITAIRGEIEENEKKGALTEDAKGEIQSILSVHVSSVVNTMLKNARLNNANGESNDAAVRTASLKLLGQLPALLDDRVLQPLKGNVVRQLSQTLDDPKRSVRKEAVDARTKWFQLNSVA